MIFFFKYMKFIFNNPDNEKYFLLRQGDKLPQEMSLKKYIYIIHIKFHKPEIVSTFLIFHKTGHSFWSVTKISQKLQGYLGPWCEQFEGPQICFRAKFAFLIYFICTMVHGSNQPTLSRAIWALGHKIMRALLNFQEQLSGGPHYFDPCEVLELNSIYLHIQIPDRGGGATCMSEVYRYVPLWRSLFSARLLLQRPTFLHLVSVLIPSIYRFSKKNQHF